MSALLQLAERCEKAAGPDDDLDCAIHEQFGGAPQIAPKHRWSSTPHYSASLDAAMQLVRNKAEAMAVLRALLSALGNDAVTVDDLPRLASAAALRARAAS